MHLCLQTVTLKILLWQGLRADLTNQRLERPQASFLVGVEHCVIGQNFTVHNLHIRLQATLMQYCHAAAVCTKMAVSNKSLPCL